MSSQAVKGHLGHCEVYRGQRKAARLPKVQPQQRSRGGRDSNESLLTLLDVHEQFRDYLLPEAAQYYYHAKLIGRMMAADDIPSDEWFQLYADLTQCARDITNMVLAFRLNHLRLFDLYHRMTHVKERWLRFRQHDILGQAPRDHDLTYAQQQDKLAEYGVDEEKRVLEQVLLGIKKMMVWSKRT